MHHRTFFHRYLLHPGEAFRPVRSTLPQERLAVLHDHDFPELVGLQQGSARHHVNDGLTPCRRVTFRSCAPGLAGLSR